MLFSIEECMKQERSTLDQLYSEYQLLETNEKEGKSYFITQRLFDTLVREEEILYPLYKINSPNKKKKNPYYSKRKREYKKPNIRSSKN